MISNFFVDRRRFLFNESLAVALESADKALVVQQIHYWCQINEENGRWETHFHDGHWWTYNSMEEWADTFEWIKKRTLRRYLTSLRDSAVLGTGNFSKDGFDKRLWYRVDHENLQKMYEKQASTSHVAKMATSKRPKWPHRSGQNGHLEAAKMATSTYRENNRENNRDSNDQNVVSSDDFVHDVSLIELLKQAGASDSQIDECLSVDRKSPRSVYQQFKQVKSGQISDADFVDIYSRMFEPHKADPATADEMVKEIVAMPEQLKQRDVSQLMSQSVKNALKHYQHGNHIDHVKQDIETSLLNLGDRSEFFTLSESAALDKVSSMLIAYHKNPPKQVHSFTEPERVDIVRRYKELFAHNVSLESQNIVCGWIEDFGYNEMVKVFEYTVEQKRKGKNISHINYLKKILESNIREGK